MSSALLAELDSFYHGSEKSLGVDQALASPGDSQFHNPWASQDDVNSTSISTPSHVDQNDDTTIGSKSVDRPLEQKKSQVEDGVEVLFDATNEDSFTEEDFGDFETGSGDQTDLVRTPENQEQMGQLLDLDFASPLPEASSQFSVSKEETESAARSIDLLSSSVQIDDWGDFNDSSETIGSPHLAQPLSKPSIEPTAQPLGMTTPPRPPSPPPTNVPPPSILLSLFTPLFTSSELITSTPQSSLLTILTTAAHIIAGRRLRWKRDPFLSQSTKIGPAPSNNKGGGGMKLTNLDPSESLKEDREAAEIVRIWQQQVGRVRSAFAPLKPPDLAETMPVRTVKLGEGGVVAKRACILCGLKRDERVQGVDGQVEDSFGEWWVELWGHRHCKKFWEAQRDELRQR